MDPSPEGLVKLYGGLPRARGDGPHARRRAVVDESLPRARGDGPPGCNGQTLPRLSPPRPRGWTLPGRRERRPHLVSPAPAGMDPPHFFPERQIKRLPRARGDGPTPPPLCADRRSSPPRPRGWTPHQYRMSIRLYVSPAPAGMDPLSAGRGVPLWCLPRARGDGPHSRHTTPDFPQSPPRPRGWTRCGDPGRQRRLVSPAPAGMDPTGGRVGSTAYSLPRARGDGPAPQQLRDDPAASPPRPRGWTQATTVTPPPNLVSPAPAGMDPLVDPARWLAARLPRARGDGPNRRSGWRRRETSPPRPRGWTLARPAGRATGTSPPRPRGWTRGGLQQPARRHVSPAPAGMDPHSPRLRRCCWRLPRARGDGPVMFPNHESALGSPPRPRGWTQLRGADGRPALVSPAPAGMDPAPPPGAGPPACLPRARGDGPAGSDTLDSALASPPRPRGWTPDQPPRPHPRRVSPAPAGMDPLPTARGRPATRLPRARGDGPAEALGEAVSEKSPPAPAGMDPTLHVTSTPDSGLPRARGDGTLFAERSPLPHRVSPAPAGMDPTTSPSAATSTRLPRARGDGPVQRHLEVFADLSPPRPRGWTHRHRRRRGGGQSPPRPRGWTPDEFEMTG